MRLNRNTLIVLASTVILFGAIATAIQASSDMRQFKAGFDCTLAKTKVENTICSVKELADADLEMSAIYRETLLHISKDNQTRLKHDQLDWLSIRNNCVSTNDIVSCLKDCYQKRTQSLIREEAMEIPSIGTKQEKALHLFKVNFSISKSIRNNDYAKTVVYPIPFGTLPIPTQVFTNNLIANKFIAEPQSLADRFYGVTLDNYTDTVEFFMSFNPLGYKHEFPELWFYNLGVAQKGGGKRFSIASLIISREGAVLYGNGNEVSPYWYIGEVKRTKAGITIDIVNNRTAEYFGTYLYDMKSNKLVIIQGADEKEIR